MSGRNSPRKDRPVTSKLSGLTSLVAQLESSKKKPTFMKTAGSGSESATRIMKAIRANMATPSLTVGDDTEEDNVS